MGIDLRGQMTSASDAVSSYVKLLEVSRESSWLIVHK